MDETVKALGNLANLALELLDAMDGMDCSDHPMVPVVAALLREDADNARAFVEAQEESAPRQPGAPK